MEQVNARRWTPCVSSEWKPFCAVASSAEVDCGASIKVTGSLLVNWPDNGRSLVGRFKPIAPEHSTVRAPLRPRAGLSLSLSQFAVRSCNPVDPHSQSNHITDLLASGIRPLLRTGGPKINPETSHPKPS